MKPRDSRPKSSAKILWNASKVPELSGAVQSKPERMSHSCHDCVRIVLGKGLLMLSHDASRPEAFYLVHAANQVVGDGCNPRNSCQTGQAKHMCFSWVTWVSGSSLKNHLDDSVQKNMKYRCGTTRQWTMDIPVRNTLKVLIYRTNSC